VRVHHLTPAAANSQFDFASPSASLFYSATPASACGNLTWARVYVNFRITHPFPMRTNSSFIPTNGVTASPPVKAVSRTNFVSTPVIPGRQYLVAIPTIVTRFSQLITAGRCPCWFTLRLSDFSVQSPSDQSSTIPHYGGTHSFVAISCLDCDCLALSKAACCAMDDHSRPSPTQRFRLAESPTATPRHPPNFWSATRVQCTLRPSRILKLTRSGSGCSGEPVPQSLYCASPINHHFAERAIDESSTRASIFR